VLVLRDIMCSGYVAGGNTLFFGTKADGTAGSKDDVSRGIQERLAMENDDGADTYGSMLAFLVKKDAVLNRRDSCFSISQRTLPWDVTNNNANGFPGGETAWAAYNSMWNLSQIHYGEDLRSTEQQDYITTGALNNALCFIGPHRTYCGYSTTNFALTPGQGHFGPDAMPGVRYHFYHLRVCVLLTICVFLRVCVFACLRVCVFAFLRFAGCTLAAR